MKKILIIKHGSLGDIISSTSVIKPIRDFYKKSFISILTSKNYSDFFKKSNFSDEVIKDDRLGFFNSLKIINKIIFSKFDLIIDLLIRMAPSDLQQMFSQILQRLSIFCVGWYQHY